MNGASWALLVGPTVLAFFTGGYFAPARSWAGVGAWLLAAAAITLAPRPLPRHGAARLAIAATAGFAAWTLLSTAWSPIAGNAYGAGQIAFLYLGALIAGALLFRRPATRSLVEPVLAGGAALVICYGLSERVLPGVLHFARSLSAQGRLEQPLTYWNAMGELAAIGLVLCARLAGSSERPAWLRCAAAATAPAIGMGLYISFSRGALFACAAGLVALAVFAPRRDQVAAATLAVLSGAAAAVVASPSSGVTGLAGSLAARERQGAVTLVALVVITAAATAVQWRLCRKVSRSRLRMPRRSG
ncbi:MAG: hypothetical protein ACRDL5_11790, partial [Solirubrobacteraceae bacterium]